MGDTIRVDVHELDDLARSLHRLSGEIEELGAALRVTQYRLCGAEQEAAGEELARSRRSLAELGERSEAAAHSIARSAEQFAACEQYEKRCFEDRMDTIPWLGSMFLRDKGRKKREFLSFTPQNVHFVRKSVSEGDKRI